MPILLGFLILFSSFAPLRSETAKKVLRVAVIDTGLNYDYMDQVPLCEDGHRDFTREGLSDTNGHGTNVVGLIISHARITGYCIILIKAYDSHNRAFLTQALEHAVTVNANVINISGGGFGYNIPESRVVKTILDKKITLILAAGNNHQNFDANCNYFPACYDKRAYVVGNVSESSNRGKMVDTIYNGNFQEAFGITLSGTSQSTAIFTGEMLKLALTPKKK